MSRARGVKLEERREGETNRERPPCEIHNHEHTPGVGADGKPRKPSGLCSECAAELAQKRRHTGSSVEEVPNPRTARDGFGHGQDSERIAKALENYEARQASRPVHVVPGSPEESRALDLIQDRRDEERDADRRKSGRVVIERLEGGDVVQYLAPRHGRGPIRRAP
jgi:hypothetical protein